MITCPNCEYLQTERAAIHEYDGRVTRAEAERLARGERCGKHEGEKDVRCPRSFGPIVSLQADLL